MKLDYEVSLNVPAEEAWRALTDPDTVQRWYFDLRPEGDWTVGGRLIWKDAGGRPGVEGVVRELEPLRRIGVETRYLFTEAVRADPPHFAVWEIEPQAGGTTRVRATFDVADGSPTATILEQDDDSALQALRIAIDPVARAELSRRDSIGEVAVHDVTPDRVTDYQSYFDNDAFRDFPAWRGCYCMHPLFKGSDDEWTLRRGEQNRADVSRLLTEGKTSALLAYADGRPVGWCHYGPTARLPLLIRRFELTPEGQEGIVSIACFNVFAPYRGHGIATRLLDAVCDRARAAGMRAVEAYPVTETTSPQTSFRGPRPMYVAAGFEPVREVNAFTIMRKNL